MAKPLAERFWQKVQKEDYCWQWTAGSLPEPGFGYGKIRVGGRGSKIAVAHRVSWFLEHGAWPSDEAVVCHRCDNPKCVRPEHLFLGTQKENIRDCIAKGRWKRHSARC